MALAFTAQLEPLATVYDCMDELSALSRPQRAHARLWWKDAAGSQCASPNSGPGDHPTVRRPPRLCHLARFGDGLTPS
jgi:hypothetical protein